MSPPNHSNSDSSSENISCVGDAGNGINLSTPEKKAKAQKVIALFASGNRELARSILKSAKNEFWLFEELLLGCKIKDGKPIPSPALKKTFNKYNTKENNRRFKFTDAKQRYAILLMLDIMLYSPADMLSLASLNLNLISILKFNRDESNLEWFYEIINLLPSNVVIEGILDLKDLTELSDNVAKHLSKESINVSECFEGTGLHLPSVTIFSDTAAYYLSEYRGSLFLEGILNLSDNTIKILSEHKVLKEECENYFNGLSLGLKHLSDNAAKFLSSYQGDLSLGIKHLSDNAAKYLSSHQGNLSFPNLETLSNSAAESLSQHAGGLILPSLRNISENALLHIKTKKTHKVNVDVFEDDFVSILNIPPEKIVLHAIKFLTKEEAEYLCNSISPNLNLDYLKHISEEIAEIFGNFNGDLSFYSLKFISPKVAKALGNHKFKLNLGFESLPLDVADGLSNHSGGIILRSLSAISDKSAEALGRTKGGLCLDSLLEVSEQGLKLLSNHDGDLNLDRLKTISDLASEALGRHEGGCLYLNGIKSLSNTSALNLSLHKGGMFLGGIKELKNFPGHIALACSLSTQKHEILYLNELKILESGPAKFLSNYKGELMLNHLNYLSDEAALELTAFKGKGLYLKGLKNPSDSLLQILSNCKCNLHLSSLKILTINGAKSLSNHEGKLFLNNYDLKMSDEAAKFLSKHDDDIILYDLHFSKKILKIKEMIFKYKDENKT